MPYRRTDWLNDQAPAIAVNLNKIEAGLLHAYTTYNVVEYGAIGDGVTDDTAAIQTAITACKAGREGTVVFPVSPNYYNVTQLTLFEIDQMNFLGLEGAASMGPTIQGSAGSVFDIQKTGNVHWRNLRFKGDGSNACFDVHGGTGWAAYYWAIDNCYFDLFDVGLQVGRNSTEEVNTYAYMWDLRDVNFDKCVKPIILDAGGFDGLSLKNVSVYDTTNVTEIAVQNTSGADGNILMDNCFFVLGSSATHGMKMHGYGIDMRSVRFEGIGNYLGLYGSNVGHGLPAVLQNVQMTRSDGSGDSIKWRGTDGLILIGGNYAGNINIASVVPCTAFNVQGTFTGYSQALMQLGQPGGEGEKALLSLWDIRAERYLELKDGVYPPATIPGYGVIYIDRRGGDLKIRFGDGTVKTIVTDAKLSKRF